MTSRSSAPALTFVIPCKGRLTHLQQSLPRVLNAIGPAEESAGIRCVVVDYGCPDHSGDWAARQHPMVQVVRVAKANDFAATRARNLGAAEVHTPWVVFMDADTLLLPSAMGALAACMQPGHYVQSASTVNDLAGFLACPLADFFGAGAYDEAMEGWGAEDRDLAWRLGRRGLTRATLPDNCLQALLHGDVQRTAYHSVQDRFLSLRINSLYLQLKMDLSRQLEMPLPLEHRLGLYQEVRRTVLAAGEVAQIEVTLPHDVGVVWGPGGFALQRKWVYQLHRLPTH